jgi:hypothetical protein
VGRKQARAALGGAGGVTADAVVLGPVAAIKRILGRVLQSADSFLASDKVDPADAADIRRSMKDIAGHRGRLLRTVNALSEQGKMSNFASSLAVVLAGAFLIGSRAGISETARRQIGREIRRLGTAAARSRRTQKRQPNEQALLSTIRAVFEGQRERSVKTKCREVNRQWTAAGHKPLSDQTIRRHRDKLSLR